MKRESYMKYTKVQLKKFHRVFTSEGSRRHTDSKNSICL